MCGNMYKEQDQEYSKSWRILLEPIFLTNYAMCIICKDLGGLDREKAFVDALTLSKGSICITLCNVLLHGLRMPNEAFFHWNPIFWGLGRQIREINFGAFGVFSADLSAPILALWVPFPCFSFPNIYLGFEFGPQRIRDLAIVCP